MSIANFFTVQIPQTLKPGQIAGGQLSVTAGVAAGVSTPGLGLFDMLLGQTTPGENGEKGNAQNEIALLQSDNPALDKNPELNIAELLAANPEIEEQLKSADGVFDLDILTEIQQALALNQQAFDETLKPLTNGLITGEAVEAGSPRLINGLLQGDENADPALLNKIKAFLSKLESISKGDTPAVDLATFNITPEQITELQQKIAAFEANVKGNAQITTDEATEQDLQDIQSQFVSILVSLVSPPQQKIGETTGTTTTATTNTSAAANNNAQPVDIAAKLNQLVVGGGEGSALKTNTLPFDSVLESDADFEALLQEIASKVKSGNGNGVDIGNAAKNNNTNQNLQVSATPNFVALNGGSFAFAGSLFTPGSFTQELGEELGLNLSALQSSPAGSMTSLITGSQGAGQAHPATQMVAATMTKSAQNGGNTNITLELDPPELGRVEVRMQFSKDKTMKAIVTTEKPETHLMLQRDGHVLEKALQDAGIDSDGGISFELAQDGNYFDQGNNRGGAHDQGGTGSGGGADGDIEIIETDLTWFVDPDTGHTHYNIWA